MIHKIIINNGDTLAYADYGDPNGYPFLAQHGLIASIKDGDLFAPLIKAGARVICAARPGYGESTAFEMKNIGEWGEWTARLVDSLGLSQFDVLGMSSGAPYCYAIGSRFTEQARNLYIFSGIPALYDQKIQSHWPFELKENAPLQKMQQLAKDLFFSNLTKEKLCKDEIKDSMRNECFGIGLDFRLRSMDWGFKLADLKQKVMMRHARFDPVVPFITAEMTSRLLPDGELEVEENDIHFSEDTLAAFIQSIIIPKLN